MWQKDESEHRAATDLDRWLVAIRDGDKAAFRHFYEATSDLAFGVLIKMLRDRSEAEDALQDVYIRVWNKAHLFEKGQVGAAAWLVVIARNLAIDRLRAHKRALPLADPEIDPPADQVGAEEHVSGRQMWQAFSACLGELDAARAGAVQAVYLEGASYQELADRLKMPINTVKTWLRRSLINLRSCMRRRQGEAPE
ncbi:sigma-70 family RNA polymerase sigma factor [Halovulum dunhuangense]|uniref:Sigma-70 family RNA polymerase sigma factor n=1 Tax=Halovulum dunhuangense TaxID=1505036 RepID=A0A849KRI9_9RHOB|nr:sigma-70 family RNA polymerase sigma factor [Halovulum dunhuangense]NNU79469.1 sigma-70 family RNA polymerase sigma factor [Halovulum dunhuangense]